MMKRYILFTLLFLFTSPLFAAEAFDNLALSKAPIDRTDMESIKRGAKFFATNCMTCHTLVYLRYDKVAQDAGITYEKMPINVKTWPYNVTPPDLSLEADVRGEDWIYTYLHSFYQDTTRPTGVNNLLVQNTAMPDIVAQYQGDQVFIKDPQADMWGHIQWYDAVKLVKEGNMSSAQFDATIADVVNFLSYAAEPYHAEQERIGYWVIGFLCILFVLMYMLKKEYWKDVKKHRRD